ncbi:MAG: sugar phosphate isomerase/epimerase family protein [Bryobacteraceae bacterium]
MISRRQFHSLALSALPAFGAKLDSKVAGVQIGVQSYSFRDRPLDKAIEAMAEAGLSSCELWQGHVEPRDLRGPDLAKWRTTVSLDEIRAIRKKFDKAGVQIYAYNYSFKDNFSDEEIARGFEMAKALGVRRITASANVKTSARIDPHARKAKIWVGMHNHSNIKANEFATPEDFAEAMKGMSEYIAINLDIGHFTAAGFDAVDYLKKNHERIVTLHIKDRKKNQGANVPFGEGDTPIKETLAVLKEYRWKIPANIEYEYKGADSLVEVKKCYEYCRKALA